jgi:hypothetical protein
MDHGVQKKPGCWWAAGLSCNQFRRSTLLLGHATAGVGLFLGGRAAARFAFVAALLAGCATGLHGAAAGAVLLAALHALGAATELNGGFAAGGSVFTTGKLLLAAIGRLVRPCGHDAQQQTQSRQRSKQLRKHEILQSVLVINCASAAIDPRVLYAPVWKPY